MKRNKPVSVVSDCCGKSRYLGIVNIKQHPGSTYGLDCPGNDEMIFGWKCTGCKEPCQPKGGSKEG